MPIEDKWFKIDESKPKNAYLLKYIKQREISVRKLAKEIGIQPYILSQALNKQKLTIGIKLKIARYFGVDSCEIFGLNEKE